MKFDNVGAFSKQLKGSAPDHFSRVYGVIVKDVFERRYFCQKVFDFIRHYIPTLEWEIVREPKNFTLCDGSLFATDRFIVLDPIDKWKEGDLDRLKGEIASQQGNTFVVLAGESISTKLFKAIETDIVALDLSKEKPWDRKRRLGEEAMKIAKGHGKILTIAMVQALMDRLGEDFAALKNEIDKLCCFVGDRPLGEEDIQAVTAVSRMESSWRLAEDLVFGGGKVGERGSDSGDVFAWIGQIRYYLNLGIELSTQGEAGAKQLRAKQKEKLLPIARRLGSEYFTRKWCDLFMLELEAKTHYIKSDVLWDRIVVSFSHDATLATQSFR